MTPKPLRTVQDLRAVSAAYRESLILLTANRLGLFELLEQLQPVSASDVAAHSRLSLRGVEILLDALVALGLVEKNGGEYSNSSLAKTALVPGSPEYLGNILDHNLHLLSRWIRLPEVVRTGKPAPRDDPERSFRAFILGMGDVARRGAKQLLRVYRFDDVHTLLDLGGGPGVYAAEICAAYPDIRATVFDVPQTREMAEATFARYGLQERMRFLGGDYLTDDYSGPYDAILMSSIIHSLGEKEINLLLDRCFGALKGGGQLLIRDFFLDESRTEPAANAVFAVNMLVATESGRCYTWSEVSNWLQRAGFQQPRQLWLEEPLRAGLLVGTKP